MKEKHNKNTYYMIYNLNIIISFTFHGLKGILKIWNLIAFFHKRERELCLKPSIIHKDLGSYV